MDDLILYILLRNDMASMNPGKAAAQACHAANMFTWEMDLANTYKDPTVWRDWDKQRPNYRKWLMQGGGFGTTITLAVTENVMRDKISAATGKFPCGIVKDTSYPLLDGQTLHLIPVDTCAYIFGPKDELKGILNELDLHP